ncbi:hypothetical protein HK096_010559, partial [Nowakowskiella sp. JEL0078]
MFCLFALWSTTTLQSAKQVLHSPPGETRAQTPHLASIESAGQIHWQALLTSVLPRPLCFDNLSIMNLTNNTTVLESSEPQFHQNNYSAVGITLAVLSGVFIGASFIFKKRGLLDTNALGYEPAKGHAYLKSPMWWVGM